jgi:hypothetical protein
MTRSPYVMLLKEDLCPSSEEIEDDERLNGFQAVDLT